MENKRKVVETVAESLLVVILIAIIAFAFVIVADLTPQQEKQAVDSVLGAEVSRVPFEFYQEDTYEQTKILESDNGFKADYNFAISHSQPINKYKVVKLNNAAEQQASFRVMINAEPEALKLIGIYIAVDGNEKLIYDINQEANLYDLVVTLEGNTTKDLQVIIKAYSEEVANEIPLTLSVEKLI